MGRDTAEHGFELLGRFDIVEGVTGADGGIERFLKLEAAEIGLDEADVPSVRFRSRLSKHSLAAIETDNGFGPWGDLPRYEAGSTRQVENGTHRHPEVLRCRLQEVAVPRHERARIEAPDFRHDAIRVRGWRKVLDSLGMALDRSFVSPRRREDKRGDRPLPADPAEHPAALTCLSPPTSSLPARECRGSRCCGSVRD